MKRILRTRNVAIVLILLALAISYLANVDQIVVGYWRGEATYGLRPTTYWVASLHSYNNLYNRTPRWAWSLSRTMGVDWLIKPAILDGDAKAIPVYLEMTRSDEEYTRGIAIQSLGLIGLATDETVPPVLRSLDEPSLRSRRNAAMALWGLEIHLDKAAPILSEHLKDVHARTYLLSWLEQHARNHRKLQAATTPLLLEAMLDEDPWLRWDAFNVLQRLDPQAAALVPNPPNQPQLNNQGIVVLR